MDFVPFIILAGMIKKIIDWLRVLLPDHYEAKVLIPASWLVGIGVALLFSTSEALAGAITIWGEHTLASADLGLVVVYGFAIASAGGIVHDITKPTTPPHDDEGSVEGLLEGFMPAAEAPLDQVTIVADDTGDDAVR